MKEVLKSSEECASMRKCCPTWRVREEIEEDGTAPLEEDLHIPQISRR